MITPWQGTALCSAEGAEVTCHAKGQAGRVPHLLDEQLQDDGFDVGSQGAGVAGLEPILLHEQWIAGQACAA